MSAPLKHILLEQTFWLSAERMLYWEEEKALIVSDLHFGKTGHFRKEGIAIPQSVYKEDLQRLVSQLQFFKPRQLIVTGDMFHSIANKEMNWFKKWREDFPDLQIELVTGNHDILQKQWYKEADVTMHYNTFTKGSVSFVHDIADAEKENLPADNYIFSGHIHPGVRISGMGKQSLHFPCFYFTPSFCVLPAFSRFTGLAMIRPKENDKVFAIVNQSIIPL
ncbi:MAG: ligase-associated DNA damage response endonuclease PdeM [Chitinophagaceae bacterium]